MRAITIDGPDSRPALRGDLPAPTPAENEVLVRVHASSVNPVDNSIAAGMLARMGVEYEYPVILGRDYAGVVEQPGAAVSRYRAGDQVYGFLLHANPIAHAGAWAELVTTGEEFQVSSAPDGVDLAIAGVAPLAGITALMSVDALDLHNGDVVLIVGATGGVGSLAVQLAARASARVLAPGLPADESFLRELGVSEMLPRDGDIARVVGERVLDGVDALLDLVNYTPGTYDAALKDGARVASPTGPPATGRGAPRSWPLQRPRTCGASPRYSPTGRCASPCGPPTNSRRRRSRSPRCPATTPRASSPSASAKEARSRMAQRRPG